MNRPGATATSNYVWDSLVARPHPRPPRPRPPGQRLPPRLPLPPPQLPPALSLPHRGHQRQRPRQEDLPAGRCRHTLPAVQIARGRGSLPPARHHPRSPRPARLRGHRPRRRQGRSTRPRCPLPRHRPGQRLRRMKPSPPPAGSPHTLPRLRHPLPRRLPLSPVQGIMTIPSTATCPVPGARPSPFSPPRVQAHLRIGNDSGSGRTRRH